MYKELVNYSKKVKSYHMPGHKNGSIKTIKDVYSIDVTEVEGTDDLHEAEGIIKTAQEYISRVYKTKKSFMLVNGSSCGLLVAISATTKLGEKILIARNSHKSIYNACYLRGLNIDYVYPDVDEQTGLEICIDAKDIQDYFKENVYKAENNNQIVDKAKVVVITSPTYYGTVSDIKKIADIVHENGGILIVDEAHGSHFEFSELLPISATNLGADIVVNSTHKTLPAFTQTAILHVCSDRVNLENVQKYLSIYMSSSPSYILMTSIIESVKYMNENKIKYNALLRDIKTEIVEQKICDKYGYWLNSKNKDISRLVFIIDVNMSGYELEQRLRKEYNIQVEMSGHNYILAIITIADSLADIKILEQAIISILKTVDSKNNLNNKIVSKYKYIKVNRPKKILKITEIDEKQKEDIELEQANGKIVAENIIPYPPGIPILVAGECITNEEIDYIKFVKSEGAKIYGIHRNKICIIKL